MANLNRPLGPHIPGGNIYPVSPPTPPMSPALPLAPPSGPTYPLAPLPPQPAPPQPPPVTDLTWLRIISQQLGEIARILSGKKGAGGGSGGVDKRPPGGGQSALTRLGYFWANVSNAAGGFGQVGSGAASGNIGKAAFGMVRAGQAVDFLAGMGGAAGAAAGGVAAGVGIAVAAYEFVKATKEAADELIKVNGELSKFSANMGLVYGQREIREILREKARGDALAGSAGLLVEQEQRFKDASLPWETAFGELKNAYYGGFYKALSDILSGINKTLVVAEDIRDSMAADSDKNSFSGMINRVADDAKAKQEAAQRQAQAQRGK